MDNDKVRVGNSVYFALVRQRLDEGDQVQIPVEGKSMQPFLKERDNVLLKSATLTDVTVGDIVLGKWNGRYVLHRIVRKKPDGLWLAGDNNFVQVEKLQPEDVMAMVIEARRGDKQLPVLRPFYRFLGMIWYYARPIRRVVMGLWKLTTNHK